MDLAAIRALIAPDMARVDTLIHTRLHSEVGLIDQLGNYIVNSGGKRLRPAVVLLSAGALGYRGTQHLNLAAIIEFIHTATLLHDDVVDASLLRRGQATANQRWGNEASVLVGDFLYSRAFQMMVEAGSMRVMEILASATNTIAEGEVQQLLNRHDPDTTEPRYLQVINNKTAKLFEAAAQLGAVISGGSDKIEESMATYGRHLGIAYQLIDDVLDYSPSNRELGKNIGDDLAEGKPTLPLLYAMWHGTESAAAVIRSALAAGGLDSLQQVLEAIESTGAIAYTARRAEAEAHAAVAALATIPRTAYRDAMEGLARFAVERAF
ncbi:MAG: octaprenyl diphosphate synthase [Gammaproteobacteria bacterium]|nr:octaprenyl diphosphate synthase [Gammaproteobacteria bacterium]